ncbi:hypothetical protein PV721_24995 [Streptomyces sp. MB09-01]|uniref:hypothetical protein n=1 Tax=Streptomyces sp. MB09-01 TaxID=3028666 RepID=UPI0029A9EA7C|nr:hypothetical protein [Streptomyces sp. MB09-01]MDX3537567.1 hypothetical protein [Streptomyces sp. MB09-01]
MAVELEDVKALRNAYSKVLDEGDALFRNEPLSKRILLAMVVSSAADADMWIGSRVPDGGSLRQELASLVEVLQKRDVIGNDLQAFQTWVTGQRRALVATVILGTTWPLWIGALGALAGAATAWVTVTAEAGKAAGRILIPLLLGLLTGGGVVLYYALRGAAYHTRRATSRAATYLFGRARNIGSGPELLFETHVRPELTALFAKHGRADERLSGPPAVLRTLRRAAGASLRLAIAVLVINLIVFAAAVPTAWEDVSCVSGTMISRFCPR